MKNMDKILNQPARMDESIRSGGVQNNNNNKYFIWILGCAMNHSDAERLSAVLDSLGYQRTFDEKESDLFIVISCSVRQSAINRIYGKIRDLNKIKEKNPNFKTILSGCVLEKDRKKMAQVFDILFEIKDLEMLPSLLNCHSGLDPESPKILKQPARMDESIRSGGVQDDKGKSGEYLSITPHYESNFRAYIPISTGCNNFCTYCAVPYTRGREKSRPLEEIVNEIKDLVKKGYKEFTLLGQNVNSYGNDLDYPSSERSESRSNVSSTDSNNKFAQLLLEIDKIPGDYRVYFYSNHPKDMSDELIETLPTLNHFPHYIHLPLQSGNDEIIKKMNRHYTQEKYLELVKKIRKALPDVALTTDIIVGFPGETEEQFQDTVEIMKAAKYDMAFIAQYSTRPGTVAAKLEDNITKEEKRRREDILQEILAQTSLEHNKKLVGTIQRVLIDGKKGDKYFGRTEGFKVVEINLCHSEFISESNNKKETLKLVQGDNLVGQFVEVKIESASAWKLGGKLL